MADNVTALVKLAETISQTAKALSAKLEENGSASPSFELDGLVEYPKVPEIVGLQMQLIDAAADMHRLALGPTEASFVGPLFLNYDASVMEILNDFDFWNAVPLDGSASFSEIASKVNLPVSIVRRILKYAFVIRLFAPVPGKPDHVKHTSFSAAPVRQPLFNPWFHHHLKEGRPASAHLSEALSRFSQGKTEAAEDLIETAFTVANLDRLDEPQSFWDYINRQVDGKPSNHRATMFTQAMQAASRFAGFRVEEILKTGYDWKALGESTIVDMGGSSGHDAILLTQEFPNLNFIVQDMPETESGFNERVPDDLRSRIRFEPHDFLKPQDTRGNVYMLKFILHDWSDKYACQILGHLVPRLEEEGSHILLFDSIAPPDVTELPFKMPAHVLAGADLQMMAVFNSMERSLDDWKALIAKVDKRLEITYISDIPNSPQNLIEIKLRK
ncbi:putative O-methyltransferase [Stachybotrys elegans]|uniref:O-methyltransferase n=1 Tax=Stachybotrys elegans TaxID=80388 RepID=A0A8K0SL66_9HYPO|nr:putative O-methyltransferase [Stachybotrys elegans]